MSSTEWDTEFVAPWYGLPSGTGCATVTPICQATLCLLEEEIIYPARKGFESRRPVLTFLIEHQTNGKKLLFDLGIGSNWLDYIPEESRHFYAEFKVEIKSELDVPLAKKGIKCDEIDYVLISHRHFDHTGTPSLFPSSTLILGPSELAEIPSLKSTTQKTQSLSWDQKTPPMASFEHSYDLFGDGSVLLLDAPGHTSGHYAALIRTSISPTPQYVILAADICHHHRLLTLLPEDEDLRLAPEMYDNYRMSGQTMVRLKECEKQEDCMVVLAHNEVQWKKWGGADESGLGPVLNGWKEKGLKGV